MTLGNMLTIFGQYLNDIGTTFGKNGKYFENIWIILRQYFDNMWTIFGPYLHNFWTIFQ